MVAKGTKRKAAAGCSENDAALERCNDLARAIKEASDLPQDVITMLEDLLPHSLGQPKDKRHRFQERAIESVDRVMQTIEQNLKKNIEDARSKLLEAQRRAAPSEEAVTKAEEKLRQDTCRLDEETKTLAKSALAFRAARTAVEETKKMQVTGDEDFESAAKKKGELQALIDDFIEPLKLGTVPESEIEKKKNVLMSSLKQFDEIDEAMMMVLGSSFAKTPDVRGGFDSMAIEQLDKCIAKRIVPLEETLRAGEAGKQERANVVKSAENALQDALEAQKQRASLFESAWNMKNEDDDSLQAARLALKDLAGITKAYDKVMYKSEAEFEVFEDYARKTFEELKERLTPPEPVEPEQISLVENEDIKVDTEPVLPEAVAVA